jgi:hypothetical protein
MKYDKMAFKYLSYVLYPLLAGYTIYSLMYEEHKSWYSFVVGTLVGFVYMFGKTLLFSLSIFNIILTAFFVVFVNRFH